MADKHYKEKHLKGQNKFASKIEKNTSLDTCKSSLKLKYKSQGISFSEFGPKIEKKSQGDGF